MRQIYFYSLMRLIKLILLVAITSCTAITSTNTSTVSPTYTPFPVTRTLILTETVLTEIPTLPTKTLIPTLVTSTPLPIPSSTIIPTLSPNEAEVWVQSLLQHNTNCRLPCWWGAYPDQTSWQIVEPFLAGFALQIIQLGDPSITPTLNTYEVYVKVSEHIHPASHIRLVYTVQEDIVSEVGIELGNSQSYAPSEVLLNYGEPTEIWLNTYNRSRESSLPFRILLFYPEQGFVVEYYDKAEEMGEQILGCFVHTEPQEHPFLFLWNPQKELHFREVLEMSGLFDEDQFYLPLTEATNIDITTFYEAFKDPNNAACLETPSHLWPAPG